MTTEPTKPHKCIDYGDPRPCCFLAEKARDLYDLLGEQYRDRGRTGPFGTERERCTEIARRYGPDAVLALMRAYNIGDPFCPTCQQCHSPHVRSCPTP